MFATMTTTKTTTCRWRRSSGDEKIYLKTKTKKTIGLLRRKRDDDDDDNNDDERRRRRRRQQNEEEDDAEKALKKASASLVAAAIVSACVADPAVAGFGAPTGAVLSPPVNTMYEEIRKTEQAGATTLIRNDHDREHRYPFTRTE